ncbi:MAG: aldo/keto reductase [Actinomycetota bacterium]|nr:aldo/keto reductase [Actinomycetota bacterium]MDH4016691.1 aldo/keto reductase [Actinomycetota bacterium]
MERRAFGSTGLQVSMLGLGADHIGDPTASEGEVARLLGTALDSGLNVIDTARGYLRSEDRIGRLISHRRDEFVLSTKVGYEIPGVPDWSGAAVTRGIDRALAQLRTDVLDVCFLHSCALDVLAAGEAVAALHAAQQAGKVRVCGYSGEAEALAWAIESGAFGAIQTSVNLADQWTLSDLLPRATEVGRLGVIAKRPLANAAWRFADRPVGDYAEPYWERLQAMAITPEDGDWTATALRFSTFTPGVSTAIVGTSSVAHLQAAVQAVALGPLPPGEVARWGAAYQPFMGRWLPQI